MKKLLILQAILIVFLCSCESDSDNKPRNTSDRMYGLGLAAIDIVDDFLNGKTNITITRERFSEKLSEIEEQYVNSQKETDSETLASTKYSNDALIKFSAGMLDLSLSYRLQNTVSESKLGTDSGITERRNDLAKRLGADER